MKITEVKLVEKEVVVEIKCDVCGIEYYEEGIPNEWHTINSHHSHYGYSREDAFESHDVCSVKCYKNKFLEIVKDYDGFKDAKIDDFEIQFARLLALTF